MAEKNKTPVYDKHKKYHDLVGKLQDLGDDEHHTGLASHVHHAASEYLHKNKSIDGKVNWTEKGDKAHREFSDKLWDTAADRIAKNYLKLSDQQVQDLKKTKTPEGENAWENMISHYLGGMGKDDFFERVKNENELTIENILKTYVNTLAGRHLQYRHTSLLKKEIKDPADMDGAAAYLGDARKHNSKSLKPLKVPKKFKSIEEAMNSLSTASQYIPRSYHPDKKDTYH
ncbi:hypothetical protein JW898_01390 [Candidatus Woesearchaeota archaeon]|nr:hypothetical protein [Candidatus Woesearchaeota archaeon]